jgi:hypothetical protein
VSDVREKQPQTGTTQALDSLNARTRRKGNVKRLMEASVEAKAKARRRQAEEAAACEMKRKG